MLMGDFKYEVKPDKIILHVPATNYYVTYLMLVLILTFLAPLLILVVLVIVPEALVYIILYSTDISWSLIIAYLYLCLVPVTFILVITLYRPVVESTFDTTKNKLFIRKVSLIGYRVLEYNFHNIQEVFFEIEDSNMKEIKIKAGLKNGKTQFLAGGNLKLIEILEHLKMRGVKISNCETVKRSLEKGVEYTYFCSKTKKIGITMSIILGILTATTLPVIVLSPNLIGKIISGVLAVAMITVIIIIQFALRTPIIHLKFEDNILNIEYPHKKEKIKIELAEIRDAWIGYGKITSPITSLKCEVRAIIVKMNQGYFSFFCPPEIACGLYRKIMSR